MNYFKVMFSDDEIKILENHNILIINNSRYYIFTEKDSIPIHGVPHYYRVEDFEYIGTSWKSLLLEFGNWFIKHDFNIVDYVDIKSRFNKVIFSKTMETNFVGPLDNGLFINNNLGVLAWQQIIDLLSYLNIDNKEVIVIHFPFQRENHDIGKLIWIKEVNLFYRYLLALGYSKENAMMHIENLKMLCKIYREGKKRHSSWYGTTFVTNPYILTADSQQYLSNAISQIKRFEGYKDEYIPTINNVLDFKKDLYYENRNYSKYDLFYFENHS